MKKSLLIKSLMAVMYAAMPRQQCAHCGAMFGRDDANHEIRGAIKQATEAGKKASKA